MMNRLAIEKELHERLKAYCKKEGLKIQAVVKKAIELYLIDKAPITSSFSSK
jgi:predicted DNA-binding protein